MKVRPLFYPFTFLSTRVYPTLDSMAFQAPNRQPLTLDPNQEQASRFDEYGNEIAPPVAAAKPGQSKKK